MPRCGTVAEAAGPRTTVPAPACGGINQLAVGPIYERINQAHTHTDIGSP